MNLTASLRLVWQMRAAARAERGWSWEHSVQSLAWRSRGPRTVLSIGRKLEWKQQRDCDPGTPTQGVDVPSGVLTSVDSCHYLKLLCL